MTKPRLVPAALSALLLSALPRADRVLRPSSPVFVLVFVAAFLASLSADSRRDTSRATRSISSSVSDSALVPSRPAADFPGVSPTMRTSESDSLTSPLRSPGFGFARALCAASYMDIAGLPALVMSSR